MNGRVYSNAHIWEQLCICLENNSTRKSISHGNLNKYLIVFEKHILVNCIKISGGDIEKKLGLLVFFFKLILYIIYL